MSNRITYKFYEPGQKPFVIPLDFDPQTFRLVLPPNAPQPDWARLDFMTCPNCPLDSKTAFCPASACLAGFIDHFAHALSFTDAVVEVETTNRIMIAKNALQYGVASLMGLVLATSGCPLTQFLRPMARFHLPFPDQQETVARSLGAWLVAEYIRSGAKGQNVALSFDGLKQGYAKLSQVNAALAARLRTIVTRDAPLNAIVILDAFALFTPDNVDRGFEDIAFYAHQASWDNP